jgi:hypothetical protein
LFSEVLIISYCILGNLKKNETELFKSFSEATKGHRENIIWGKKTKIHELIKKNGTKNGNGIKSIKYI